MTRRGLIVALALLCAGCGQPGVTDQQPNCSATTADVSDEVLLMAQSVPTASWIPCLLPMPVGWLFAGLDARNDGARFWLDSDRDGTHAVEIELSADCDVTGSTEVPSDQEKMRRYERVTRVSPGYAGERYYRFIGGCVTYHWNLQGTTRGEPLAAVSQAIGFMSRSGLRAHVREDSDGRLDLDPPPGAGN